MKSIVKIFIVFALFLSCQMLGLSQQTIEKPNYREPKPANLPDLEVMSVTKNVQGGNVTFSVVIKNMGTKPASGCTLLFDTQRDKKRVAFSSLAAGASRTISSLTCKCDNPGAYNLRVQIDADNVIKEIDESNNFGGLTLLN